MLRLYDYLDSGNGYKVRLLLRLLDIPFERVELDIMQGETRTPPFLAKNPAGKIPTLEFDDGRTLAESNAILFHLAEGTPYLPEDAWERAQALRWLFFEQYSHEPYIAVARFMLKHLELTEEIRAQLPDKQTRGYAALDIIEAHLKGRDYFVGERMSIADIALYAYTHVAGEGGFELPRYSAITAWCARVASQPGHTPITKA